MQNIGWDASVPLNSPLDEATTKAVEGSIPEARVQQRTITEQELMTDLKGAAPQSAVEQATIMNVPTAR